MKENEVLESNYNAAKASVETDFPPFIMGDIDILIEKIESNKSIVLALVTSLVKKIIEPEQDIRLHRKDFIGGYSARVLDTQVIVPFFKDKFPKYASKESSFLNYVNSRTSKMG